MKCENCDGEMVNIPCPDKNPACEVYHEACLTCHTSCRKNGSCLTCKDCLAFDRRQEASSASAKTFAVVIEKIKEKASKLWLAGADDKANVLRVLARELEQGD